MTATPAMTSNDPRDLDGKLPCKPWGATRRCAPA